MKTVNMYEIQVRPDRQRQTFDEDAIADLALSIDTIGLLHPITLDDDGDLIAGEYRLRALKYLHEHCHVENLKHSGQVYNFPTIPVAVISELTKTERFQIELEENLKRTELTWQEEAQAIADFHTMLTEVESEAPSYTVVAEKLADLKGEEVRAVDVQKVVKSVQIIDFLDIPEVAQAPSLKDAETAARKHILKDLEETLAESGLKEIAEAHELLATGDTKDSRCLTTVKQGNYQDNLVADVDLYLLDPPYFVGADNFGTQAVTEHNYDDSPERASEFYKELAQHTFKGAKEMAHLFMFLDFRHWETAKKAFTAAGWDVWAKPLIWVKDTGMYPNPYKGPRYTYELIMFANKGDASFSGAFNDTFIHDTVQNKSHAAEKPPMLLKQIAKNSIQPGSVVVDYFGGSGSIIEALKDYDIFLHVVELDKKNYNLCLGRL